MNNSIEAIPIDSADIDLSRVALEYNRDMGVFFWKTGSRKGRLAGTKTKYGYVRIQINKSLIFAHRLVWAFETGEYPQGYIDHINQDKLDNRFSNLRVVSKSQNSKNLPIKRNNITGVNGVSWCKRNMKWCAQIGVDMKRKHLGYFDDIEEAKEARKKADNIFGFTNLHGAGHE